MDQEGKPAKAADMHADISRVIMLPIKRPATEAKAEKGPQPTASRFVCTLIANNRKFASWWAGSGKINGDTSESSYDRLVAKTVLKAGGTVDDAISAMMSRQDGHAFARGEEYARTVCQQVAVEVVGVPTTTYVEIESVKVQLSNPPIYTMSIRGREVQASAGILLSRVRFQNAVLEACNFIPKIPANVRDQYVDWMNEILARAEPVEVPPEADTDFGEREDIQHAIKGLSAGETREDMERGAVIVVDDSGACYLHLRPLLHTVRVALPNLTRPTLVKHLRSLGWEDARLVIEGAEVRCWRGKR